MIALETKLAVSSIASSTIGVFLGLTDAVSIAIVTQIGALALAGLAAWISWRTHKAVNSRMDEFKLMFAQAKINEGVLQEKKDEVVRKAEIVIAVGQSATPDIAPPQHTQPSAMTRMAKAIDEVPDLTAVKVVEKLAEK